MNREIFKKRIKNTSFAKENCWCNVSGNKILSSRLCLSHFAEVECLPGEYFFKIRLDDEWTFHLMRTGEMTLHIPKVCRFPLTPSEVYVFQPRDEQAKKAEEYVQNHTGKSFRRYYFAIKRNAYIEQFFHLEKLKYVHLNDPAAVWECVEKIGNAAKQDEGCSADDLSVLLFRFLTLITAETPEKDFGKENYGSLIETIRRFPQNYPTMRSLQEAFGVSRGLLQKIFHEYTGKSPVDFVIYSKLDVSRWMLLHSELQIREIAQLNGYGNPAFYSRAFRQTFGMSPAQYRKKYCQAKQIRRIITSYRKKTGRLLSSFIYDKNFP